MRISYTGYDNHVRDAQENVTATALGPNLFRLDISARATDPYGRPIFHSATRQAYFDPRGVNFMPGNGRPEGFAQSVEVSAGLTFKAAYERCALQGRPLAPRNG